MKKTPIMIEPTVNLIKPDDQKFWYEMSKWGKDFCFKREL